MVGQILLVDHEKNRGRLLQRRLERHGFSVTTVASLDEATECAQLPSRVLLVDLAMVCGPERDRMERVMARLLGHGAWSCPACGRHLVETAPGAGELACCGSPMRRSQPLELVERELDDAGATAVPDVA